MNVLSAFLLSVLFFSSSLACSTDCYQCHSNISKDREHKVISTCTNCHPEHSESAVDRCGADCFECHSYKKVMESSSAHRVIGRCIECHTGIKKEEEPEPLEQFLE